eukprot:TRINITY_DN8982_c0_g1_i2.p1 TRINITY_DN8982_c0_g1~~TRINITY_DN8982_c0_g1_i2.p1  ORF type:complete len:240 (-),score=74.45 TRINITY_DN8982_c0_g1_i2:126-845(-)
MCIRDSINAEYGGSRTLPMSEPPKAKAVAGVQRRQWDKAHFAALAQDKAATQGDDGDFEAANERQRRETPMQRAPLQRDAERDKVGSLIESKINKRKMMSAADSAAPGGGGAFTCDVTGKTFHDSLTYLDHINGKKYQREKGQNMRAERSTLDGVKGAFARATERKKLPVEEFKGLDERMDEARESEDKHKRQKRDYKEWKREEEQREFDEMQKSGMDAESLAMAEMMGMPMSFGTSKK